jgi:hypothetical protein
MVAPWFDQLRCLRGRWIGRKDATVAGARGIAHYEARRILAARASELRGSKLKGYWVGVKEIRPEWGMALPLNLDTDQANEPPLAS